MSCGISLVKFVLFVFNLICALCGIALVTTGVGILWKFKEILDTMNENNINVAPFVFIVIGSAVFLIAFFGCCGAIQESECMISTYAVLLFLLLVAQIIVGVLIFTNKHDVQQIANQSLRKLWAKKNTNEGYKKAFESVQSTFQCCGLNHPTEWGLNTPQSCCKEHSIECVPLVNSYNVGCLKAVNDTIAMGSVSFGSFAISVAVVELVGFIFACILSNHIRNYKRRLAY